MRQKLFDKRCLQERFSTGQADRMTAFSYISDLLNKVFEFDFRIITRGVADGRRCIAPDAVHIAFKKTHEDLFDAGVFTFALDGLKYLEDVGFHNGDILTQNENKERAFQLRGRNVSWAQLFDIFS